MVDKEGRILFVNSQTQKLFGYCRSELLGKGIEILLPERYRKRHVEHLSGYFAQPQPRPIGSGLTLLGLHKDGSEFPVEIALNPFETEEGLVAISTIRDITESKEIKKRLEEDSQALEDLARFPSENPNPILRVATEGTVLYANVASHPLLREWGSEMGQPVPDDWKRVIGEVYDSRKSKEIEVRLADQTFSILLIPVADTKYVNLYGLNITDRKRAEEEIKKSHKMLSEAENIAHVGSFEWSRSEETTFARID